MSRPRPLHSDGDAFDGVDRVCYEAETSSALLPVSLALAFFYLAFAALHHATHGRAPFLLVDSVAVASSLVAVVVAVAAWRHRVPDRRAHATMTLLVAVTTVNTTVHLIVTRDPDETVGFVLLLVGIGVVLLRRAWLIPTAVGIWTAWLLAVAAIGGGVATWGQWVFYLVTAGVLGAVITWLRRRSTDAAAATLRGVLRAATQDPATGLANRRGLAILSRELIELAKRRHEIMHCTFLDVDGLKQINDTHGHDAGDRVILAVAEGIRATCRSSDVIARWGGDEFVVVGLGPSLGSHELERRVSAHLVEHHAGDRALAGLHISAGRAEIAPWEGGDTEALLRKADHDMYQRRALRPGGGRRKFGRDAWGLAEL